MTRLAEVRHEQHITAKELAAAAHVTYSTIAMIECGAQRFNGIAVATAMRIADALGVDVTELMEPGWEN